MMISKAPLFTGFRKVNIQPRSSVLSLCDLDPEIDPAGNVVMSGLRSGAVGQYDMRTPWLDAGRQPALQTRTPVVGLQSCGGWNLAVAGMDGTVSSHHRFVDFNDSPLTVVSSFTWPRTRSTTFASLQLLLDLFKPAKDHHPRKLVVSRSSASQDTGTRTRQASPSSTSPTVGRSSQRARTTSSASGTVGTEE